MTGFTNLNAPTRELTPDELKLLAMKPVFITDDEADEEKPAAEQAPTLH